MCKTMFAEGYYYVQDKDILDQHLAELRADLEHFLEHGDESVFENNPYFRSDFQEFQVIHSLKSAEYDGFMCLVIYKTNDVIH